MTNDTILTILGDRIEDLDATQPSTVDPLIIGLLKFTLTQISPIKVTARYNGQPLPSGYMPITGAYPATKFDVDLAFTGCQAGQLVEMEFEIQSAVPLTFIAGKEITGADDNALALMKRFSRAGDGAKKARVVCGRSASILTPVAYNIGIVVDEGDGYSMPTYWDPKIKNHG